jgi:hypothetical protein
MGIPKSTSQGSKEKSRRRLLFSSVELQVGKLARSHFFFLPFFLAMAVSS